MSSSDSSSDSDEGPIDGADEGPIDGADEAQSTRPISVAELLARHGTIGAPPAGGHRRRRRGNSAAVTVAELTGEIPVIRDEPAPEAAEPQPEPQSEPQSEPQPEPQPELQSEPQSELQSELQSEAGGPPLADDPRPPSEEQGPPLSHDPRPERRSSGAEEMAFDPVDGQVDLAGLVLEAEEEQQLRSYLRASGGTLFSGETVADDLARRGIATEDAGDIDTAEALSAAPAPRPGRMAVLRQAMVAVGQSALAVLFGAGLFVGFDQLWRWNTIVALVLSVLVILGLVVAVRVVRKTEDIASTLIAVAVGALVTLGPLALLQSYG